MTSDPHIDLARQACDDYLLAAALTRLQLAGDTVACAALLASLTNDDTVRLGYAHEFIARLLRVEQPADPDAWLADQILRQRSLDAGSADRA